MEEIKTLREKIGQQANNCLYSNSWRAYRYTHLSEHLQRVKNVDARGIHRYQDHAAVEGREYSQCERK